MAALCGFRPFVRNAAKLGKLQLVRFREMSALEPIEHSNRDFVTSLAKGLRVLRSFNQDTERMTVSDIAKVTELTRAGARRLLLTMHALGYMQTDGKYYSLSPKVLELGFSYLSSQSWLSVASPFLERLRDELNEAVSVTVLEDTDVVYVARFQTDQVMTIAMDIGAQKPAYCTAMGRVLMGALPETKVRELLLKSDIKAYTSRTLTDIQDLTSEICKVKNQGYCLIDRELEDTLVAISVPITNCYGKTLAAVNVCGHPGNLSLEELETRCLTALKNAAEKISKVLV